MRRRFGFTGTVLLLFFLQLTAQAASALQVVGDDAGQRADSAAVAPWIDLSPAFIQPQDTLGVPSDIQQQPDGSEITWNNPAFRLPYRGSYRSPVYLKSYPRLYYLSLPDEQLVLERLVNYGILTRYQISGSPASYSSTYSFDEYKSGNLDNQLDWNWRALIEESEQVESQQRGLLDFRFDIPSGEESAFSTIFGRPEVNLRINALANMNIGASIQHTSDPSLPEDQQTRVDPLFDQSLQLNIQGTVGDKLTIQTDWDTQRQFDFQNTINIQYQGYEDEIFKQIELGNVSMQTGNSLIRGSGSLLGIKAVAELGSLRLTSILTQQKGESSVETITGGAQQRQISLTPAQYENNRHFHLGFYTRQEFEQSMSNPQLSQQTLQLSEINVWLLRENVQTDQGAKLAVALVDYGVVGDSNTGFGPPDNDRDQFPDGTIDALRDPSTPVTASQLGLEDARNFEEGYFTLLREFEDYTVNDVSGFISLTRELGSRDVLAVSYTYVNQSGETVYVGDVNQGGSDRIFLKMLRPSSISTDHKAFPLTMRNVYSLGITDITRESLELDIQYTEENLSQENLPGRTPPLIQDLGLDRTDSQGALFPDNLIDFGTGTLNTTAGKIIFPYLEPFGNHLEDLLVESGAPDQEIERLVFDELYSESQQNAARLSQNSFYRISGTARGGTQDSFSLGIALVEGSVHVFANGLELIEGMDYVVDYLLGQITILNPRYTSQGQEIRIEYENQAFVSIEQKSFTGLRAEYLVSDDIRFGSTFLRYNEQPLDDKIRLGDEPINNTVIGFDANARFDAPFITRLLNSLPLISTNEASEISFSGEFAQLRPGVAYSRAMERAVRNNELFSDEVDGLSYIDDFEGSSIKIDLMNVTRWQMAAAPAAVPGYGPDEMYFEDGMTPPASSPLSMQIERSDLRSMFSWYSIPRNIDNILDDVEFTPESEPVQVTDVFPGRETRNPQEEFISTLDVYFDPARRGAYNYNENLRSLLEEEPDRTWGGMTTIVPSGLEDFSQNNVEFLEFWVQPLLPGGLNPMAGDLDDYDGTVYIDIGTVSEDIVPNAKLNTEDGLALNPESLIPDRVSNPRSYIPANPPPPEGEFSISNRDLEDVGLDGLPSQGGINGISEQSVFSGFIESVRQQYGEGGTVYNDVIDDPSADDYFYYGESAVSHLPLHRRFHRMMGFYDGNTPLVQSEKKAVTNRPNTEGLLNTSRVELNNAYYQYEVDLNPASLANSAPGQGSGFIIDQVPGNRPADRWYLVRIPLDEFAKKVGDINDFQNITYVRVWMSGYKKAFTMRFATMEFVGSQWQSAENINKSEGPNASIKVSTTNIEENSNRRPVPYRQPQGAIRAQNRSSQLQSLQNEQSLVLQVENLGPDELQMVKRTFPGGLNLLNHSNMRMFVHGEGYDNRTDAELVIRMGNDLENNYYEYRQPVTPSDPDYPFMVYDPSEDARLAEESREVWKYDENSMNIILSAFNQLKQLRNQEAPENPNELYERSDLLDDAVPGASIAIKGNPSLDRVNEIGIGIQNPFDPSNPMGVGRPMLTAQFWLNELRVSGFDNKSGWAASARSSIQMADFAVFNANVLRQTDGFGSLDSRLGQRRISDEVSYDLSSTVGLHKFIPERFGWNIPVTFTTRKSTSTPRYLPNEGDIRLSDYADAIRARDDLNESQQNQLINQRTLDVQTVSESYSVNLSNISKQNSQNRVSQILLDNTTFNYVYNTTNARSPQDRYRDNWNFNSSLRYDLDFQSNRYFTPFGLFDGLPLLDVISGLEVGYLPTNISSSISANRMYEERKRRIQQPGGAGQPLQQTHFFEYNTRFGFEYNLTRSIATGFESNTIFDLNRVAIENASLGGVDSTAYRPIPTVEVLKSVVSGDATPRRSAYEEDYSASWQPSFNQIQAIDWMTYSVQYGGGFRWENAPLGSNLGSRVSNTFRLDHTVRFDMESFLGRSFRNALEDAGTAPGGNASSDSLSTARARSLGGVIVSFGRELLLKLTSLQTINLSYGNAKTGSQAGYNGESQLIHLFGGGNTYSPPFAYRMGIADRIDNQQLIGNTGNTLVQIPANNIYSDSFTLGSVFEPFNNLSIDLSWLAQWDERSSESITLGAQDNMTSVFGGSGNISSSVWAFGGGYRELFEQQLQTAFNDINNSGNVIDDSQGNQDGRTVLNRVALQEDFRQAYLGGGRSVGSRNFTPFPVPGWRVNLSGLESLLPFLGTIFDRASILHAYEGRYTMGWLFNNDTSQLPSRQIGAYNVVDFRPEFEPTVINVNKSFSPLLQLNLTWSPTLYTELGYSHSKRTSFALSNINIIERTQKQIRFTLQYTIQNFSLPLFRNLTNNLDLSFSGEFIEDTEQQFLLDADIDQALRQAHDTIIKDPSLYSINPRAPTGTNRINASTVIGYRFSNMIQANFEYTFGRSLPKSSRTFDRTTHDIRFNIRLNLQSG